MSSLLIQSSPKVAVVHDWLVLSGGDVRVLEQIFECFPDADMFATIDFLPEKDRGFLRGKSVQTSFIQSLPRAKKWHWYYMALMPIAIEQFDFSGYDIIITSHHAVAKGIIVNPDQLHISYIHSPMRFAWDLQSYYFQNFGFNRGIKALLARLIFHYLRIWDCRATNGVDELIANSHFIVRRIQKTYRRPAQVIYPPVNVDVFQLHEQKEDFYLTAGSMNPFKRVDLVVEAFANMPNRKLYVIGKGPDLEKVKSKAGPNVEFLGYQPLEVLVDYMQRAKAFVYAAPEDFGIIIGEAQACGTPVIAFGKGGSLEIVRDVEFDHPTGVLFPEQTVTAVVSAVERFEAEQARFLPQNCRDNALRFSPETFRTALKDFVQEKWQAFKAGIAQTSNSSQ